MKRKILIILVAVLVAGGLANAEDLDYRPGYMLVRFADSAGQPFSTQQKQSILDSLFGCTCAPLVEEYHSVSGLGLVRLPAGVTVESARVTLNQSPSILYAEPDYRRYPSVIPNDTRFAEMWGLDNTGQAGGNIDADIDAPEAWDIETGKSSIIVAVTDTGVDYTHPDLAGNIWINSIELNGQAGIDDDGNGYIDDIYGVDTGSNDGNPMDDAIGGGHGTHVAGTIGAMGNNNRGVVGVCWDVSIMAVKIADANGVLWTSAAIAGIQYAIDKDAHVMNASWGGYFFSQALYNVIAAARDAGILFVAAAGNEQNNNDSIPSYPCSYDLDNIISVMATNNSDQSANYSNYGSTTVDLGAPGGEMTVPDDPGGILSTWRYGGYEFLQGTSMASPHVAGACALVLSVDSSLGYTDVKSIIMNKVDPVLPGLCVSGGRLNLYKAAAEAAIDKTAPTPNPILWDMPPQATGLHTIAMEAGKATDRSEVQYYFECVNDVNINSGWQDNTLYVATALEPNTTYGFRAKARDKSLASNETGWSTTLYDKTAVGQDNLPPAPNPSRWYIKPKVHRLTPPAIRMRAKTATDESGVQYYFECIEDVNINSGWQDDDTFNVTSGVSAPNTYTFRFRTRDKSALNNMTDWSSAEAVALAAAPRVLKVPQPYHTIQDAVDAAVIAGDIVEISPGTYTGYGNRDIQFNGIAITVRSVDPEDPNIVATTVVNCQGMSDPQDLIDFGTYLPHRGFLFTKGEPSNTVLAGLTIINGSVLGGYGVDGDPGADNPSAGGPGGSGGNGVPGGIIGGGGILIGRLPGIGGTAASPTIRNCVINNCQAAGGAGGDGGDGGDGGGYDPCEPDGPAIYPGPGGHGGAGGDGGDGLGGGIYCSSDSHPTIDNCIITNCLSIAGNGGNGGGGGDGGQGDDAAGVDQGPGGAGGGGGDGGDNFGGGLYAEDSSYPTIINCTISDCTIAGAGGVGGAGGIGGVGVPLGSSGERGEDGDSAGGGVYCGLGSTGVDISGTTLSRNTCSTRGGGIYLDTMNSSALTVNFTDCNISENNAYDGGGVWLHKGGKVIFSQCRIADNNATNAGGGVYGGDWDSNSAATVELWDSNVVGNIARYGGGMYFDETVFTASGSTFIANSSREGGALNGFNCTLDISDCTVTENTATLPSGFGGGFALWNGRDAEIKSTLFSGNTADLFGGAVFLAGSLQGSLPYQFTNCLVTDNTAYLEGGGISCNTGAWAQLTNCTIADNSVLDPSYGSGGGVSCAEFYAWVEITSSILWANNAENGPQIAVGTLFGSSPDPGGVYADVDVSYSNVQGGEASVFLEDPAYTAIWWFSGNRETDPLFASTDQSEPTYYLSQTAAGQLSDSPCVDAGLGSADDLAAALGTAVTTRTDNVPDTGVMLVQGDANTVDMGFHYPADVTVKSYQLTIQVVDQGGAGPFGTVAAPWSPGTYSVGQGTVVELTAEPNQGWEVYQWAGTDTVPVVAGNPAYNTVTMNANKTVTVEFSPIGKFKLITSVISANGQISPAGLTIYDPGTVVDLLATPDNPSDVVIWTGSDDDYSALRENTVTMDAHKNVTVEFYSPRVLYVGSDSQYQTIQLAIDDAQNRDIVMITPGTYDIYESSEDMPFLLISGKDITVTSTSPEDANATQIIGGFVVANVDRNCVIQGLTITAHYVGGTPPDPSDSGVDGARGGDIWGGGMELIGSASPMVRNCVFLNCSVRAGNGANGSAGIIGGDGGWAGAAYGGGASVGNNGKPLFENTSFIGCFTVGGDGGNGGNGQPGNRGGHGGNWGDNEGYWWDYGPFEEYWRYSGYGGAVYCGLNSAPEFENCTFQDNHVYGGSCGVSGTAIPPGWPSQHYKIDRFGGAVYIDRASSPTFTDCVFTDNVADPCQFGDETHRMGGAVVSAYLNVSYGGAIAFELESSPQFIDSTFENSFAHVGGGGYGTWSYPMFDGCRFNNNDAFHGAGALIVGGTSDFESCDFVANQASLAAAQGGALTLLGGDAEIIDCNIRNNQSAGFGGGIYTSSLDIDGSIIPEPNNVVIHNCLIVGNIADQGGGGISANWHSDPNIINCTIANNTASAGNGGGLLSAYGNYTRLTDNILWGNTAVAGSQIAIATALNPSWVRVIYSDVQDGASLVQIEPGSTLEWDLNAGDPAYPTNIHDDPLFVDVAAGDYHLSQIAAGQLDDSPCVDAGSALASDLGFTLATTRTDQLPDRTIVDMGYHYRLKEPCRFSDLNRDGIVNFADFSFIAQHWMDEGCGLDDGWCDGADITFDSFVDWLDMDVLASCWLAEDTLAPIPDPMQWQVEPVGQTDTEVAMLAATATDTLWGLDVEYFFTCYSGACHDSGWITEPNYTDVGLDPNTEYGYRVKARDIRGNETGWSAVRFATTGGGGGIPTDNDPPNPNPMTWDTLPYATAFDAIEMEATTATDVSPPVQYFFEETTGGPGGSNSGWINSTLWTDIGLDPNTLYCYHVRARDVRGNETGYSSIECALTPGQGAQPDANAPDPPPTIVITDTNTILAPFPNTFSAQFQPVGQPWWHKVVADVSAVADDSGGPIEIKFICVSNGTFSSDNNVTTPQPILIGGAGTYGSFEEGWQLTYDGGNIVYDVDIDVYGGIGTTLEWKVCAYDLSMNEACSTTHKIGPKSL